jgi:hypothetical protein
VKNLLVILSILISISACNERKAENSKFEEVVDEAFFPFKDQYSMELDEQENMVSPLNMTNTDFGNSNFGSATMHDAKGNYYYGTTWNPSGSNFGSVNFYDNKGNYYYGTTWNPSGSNFGSVNIYDNKGNYHYGTTWNPNANTSNTFQNNNLQRTLREQCFPSAPSSASNIFKDSEKKGEFWY